jgi:hypothetical protein
MKKASILLALIIFLIGSVIVTLSLPSPAQVHPPRRGPWTGAKTPWTYYHGDWFHNGTLHYYYGRKHGWAPYYARPFGRVERPGEWYGEKWEHWYREHPKNWENFEHQYPYWRGHRVGEHYDENFYNRYHQGQGGGWQKPYQGEEQGEHGEH